MHQARTMMFSELQTLLSFAGDPKADKAAYFRAIEVDNCLGKRSGKTRMLTSRHLAGLYGLDPSIALFRALLYFWDRDQAGRPLLALLCACARDSVLRENAGFILGHAPGDLVSREALEKFIDNRETGRFSPATLKSTAQNIDSTFTQSGHLQGRARKIRNRATATAGSTAYALFLEYLSGMRGLSLFSGEYIKLLDCPQDQALELAENAAKKGWMRFKRIGNVIDVGFPKLLTGQEMEWIREQN